MTLPFIRSTVDGKHEQLALRTTEAAVNASDTLTVEPHQVIPALELRYDPLDDLLDIPLIYGAQQTVKKASPDQSRCSWMEEAEVHSQLIMM